MADHLAVLNMPMDALKRSHTVDLVRAVHAVVGAVGGDRAHRPRRHRLDHLRCAVSTSRAASPRSTISAAAAPAGTSSPPPIPTRRSISGWTITWSTASATAARASSTMWSPGCGTAGPMTPSSATSRTASFSIPTSMHVLDHKGKYLSVRGPLNIARPIQGWPVIVQAGASEAGRQLAAETAEACSPPQAISPRAADFYADVKGRMAKLGRAREHMKILPARFVVVGDTRRRGAREAREARQPGALRQRHRLAIDRARPRCLEIRSRWAAAGQYPGEQRFEERTRASDRSGQAREPDRAPARAAARRLFRPRYGRHARDNRRRDGGMARNRGLATASP